jgi:hypothetical protein
MLINELAAIGSPGENYMYILIAFGIAGIMLLGVWYRDGKR